MVERFHFSHDGWEMRRGHCAVVALGFSANAMGHQRATQAARGIQRNGRRSYSDLRTIFIPPRTGKTDWEYGC